MSDPTTNIPAIPAFVASAQNPDANHEAVHRRTGALRTVQTLTAGIALGAVFGIGGFSALAAAHSPSRPVPQVTVTVTSSPTGFPTAQAPTSVMLPTAKPAKHKKAKRKVTATVTSSPRVVKHTRTTKAHATSSAS